MEVLAESGRIVVGAEPAEVLFASAAVEVGRGGVASMVIPTGDETLLPALNRRLATARIPWTYEAPVGGGEARVEENRLPVFLDDIRVMRHYRLLPAGSDPPAGDLPVRLTGGDPLFVTGRANDAPYLLLATPLDANWSSLPVAAEMIPLLEWIVSQWARGAGGSPSRLAGEPIPLPPAATSVEEPGGIRRSIDGARLFRETRDAGLYRIMQDDGVLEQVAVNPPPPESDLTPASAREVRSRLGSVVHRVDDERDWQRSIFTARQGPELWRPLLVAALLILVLESWFASAGAETRPGRGRDGTPVSPSRRAGSPRARREEAVATSSETRA